MSLKAKSQDRHVVSHVSYLEEKNEDQTGKSHEIE